MKASWGFLGLVALTSAAEVTPVQKVVALLGGMLEKGKKEKHDEQVMFAASRQFCSDQESLKVNAIKESGFLIGSLTATINKDIADASSLQQKIGALDKDENTWTGDKKAAQGVRQIERADYETTHKDYSQSIDSIGLAVTTLKKQSSDRRQADSASLMQVRDLGLIPAKSQKAINAFLQQGAERVFEQDAPEANAYEFQASGIVEMLQKLQDKFIDERTNLEKEEANSKHSFGMLIQDLDAQVQQAQEDSTEKSTDRGARLQSKAMASGDLVEESSLKTTDSKSLSDMKSSCALQSSDFESRQSLRSLEIQGIEKAMEILSGNMVAGNAAKHLPALLQSQKSSSFASLGQLRSTTKTIQDIAVSFLKSRASKLKSRVLATIAERASVDPFGKVKKMLKDLVVRLLEEANEEAEHKGWCDTELGTNSQTRIEKTNSVETLQAAIDELGASISKTTEKISGLTKAVAQLNSAMSTATNARNAENAENKAAISDAQDAQTAVAQAITVLKEFYSKAGEATSFIQQPYQGMQDENGGVMGMLEVIESDFARLESEVKANEATAQKQYDTFMTDSKADRASKNTAIEHKEAKKQDQSQALTQKKLDLEETQQALDAALQYFDKLKPSCVDSGVSYEDRVQRRKDEIESLQEALKVMNGEDLS